MTDCGEYKPHTKDECRFDLTYYTDPGRCAWCGIHFQEWVVLNINKLIDRCSEKEGR